MNWKDILSRAAKTFVQTLLAAFPVSAAVGANIPALKAAAIAAGAAALAVVWNGLLQWSRTE